ncbi:MAG: hypothetical protein SFX18_06100 [Pirellulales bacterium]|nr:hypothetical protein [Pirellulales bacterium]
MQPYAIHCQTCQAALVVNKPEAIGLILACPRCSSMVEVTPPPQPLESTSPAALQSSKRPPSPAPASVPATANGSRGTTVPNHNPSQVEPPKVAGHQPVGALPASNLSLTADPTTTAAGSGMADGGLSFPTLCLVGGAGILLTGGISFGLWSLLRAEPATVTSNPPAIAALGNTDSQNNDSNLDSTVGSTPSIPPTSTESQPTLLTPRDKQPVPPATAANPVPLPNDDSSVVTAPSAEAPNAKGSAIGNNSIIAKNSPPASALQPPPPDTPITEANAPATGAPQLPDAAAPSGTVPAGVPMAEKDPLATKTLKLDPAPPGDTIVAADAPQIPRANQPLPSPIPQSVPPAEAANNSAGNRSEGANPVAVKNPAETKPATVSIERFPPGKLPPDSLDLRLNLVNYDQVPLWRMAREISTLTGAPVQLNPLVLETTGWRCQTPVTVRLELCTAREALAAAALQAGLELLERETYWELALPGEMSPRARYQVDDLATPDNAIEAEIAAPIRRLIEPASWGVTGKLEARDGALLVDQSAAAQDQIIVFCEKLRQARGLKLRTKYDPRESRLRRFDPARFALTTRRAAAAPLLAKQVKLYAPRGESLQSLINQLEQQTGAVIQWDWGALTLAQAAPGSRVTADSRPENLSEALARMLTPLRLTAIPIDHQTLWITSEDPSRQSRLLEWYQPRVTGEHDPVAELLTQYQTLATTAGLRQPLAAADCHWDLPSQTLIVRGTAAQHEICYQLWVASSPPAPQTVD